MIVRFVVTDKGLPAAFLVFVLVLVCSAAARAATPQPYLPLGLRFGMSSEQAQAQMETLASYKVPSSAGELAYVVQDAGEKTRTGLFLEFDDGSLVEVESMKAGLTGDRFDTYKANLLATANAWLSQGAVVVMADKNNGLWIYQDGATYMQINEEKGSSPSLSVAFIERSFFEGKHPHLRKSQPTAP